MIIAHPSVLNVGQEDVFEDGAWRRQMIVETSLPVDASGPDYNADEVTKLQEAVVDFMKTYPSLIDSVVVRYRDPYS